MKRMAGVMAKLRSRRWGIAILLLAVLALLVPAVAYASQHPPTSATVVMSNQGFQFSGGNFYGGGVTVTGGTVGDYTWYLQATKGKHIFEVEKWTGTAWEEITEIVLSPRSTAIADFALLCSTTYKIYCPLHEKSGAAFKLTTTACP